jgi:hypothetical protein
MKHADLRARQDADRIRHKAFWHQVIHKLTGAPNTLLSFDDVKQLYAAPESYSGIQSIPIEGIVGSVDRYKDFDHYFLPRYGLPLDRWVRVRRAKLEGLELPAIQVYKVGDLYFVKDGHHRVSVARDEGQQFIDAEIIELQVRANPHPGDSMKELIIKSEYDQFLNQSKLHKLRPNHTEIRFSVTGRYDILLEHIKTHQYFLGSQHKRAFGWDEAVTSWYDTLYLPLVEKIKQHRVLRRFPGRTEADLYIWMMDHHHFLRQELGRDVGFEKSVQDYVDGYAPNWWHRLGQCLSFWRRETA